LLLAGRSALVTGAAGSIGEAVATRLAEEGCAIVMADKDGDRLDVAARRLRERFGKVESLELDVADESAVQRMFAATDRLDILANIAGVTRSGSVEDLSLAEWNELLAVNLTSVFLCCKYALPLLKRSKTPSIVNMASTNALLMNPGLPAYTAAKSSIIAFTRQLVLEGAAARIRANCISPGLTAPPSHTPDGQDGDALAIALDCYPLGRFGLPEDVANATLFLASDLSAFVNGINLVVDGGLSVQSASGLVRPDLRSRWKNGKYTLHFDEEGEG